MISLNALSIGYQQKNNQKVVAENISSVIRPGELTCLIGPNGVGKSTLLRTLSAFQPPLSGEIYVDEKNLAQLSDREIARLIGVVLTTKPDVQNMTVSELVALGRAPYTGFWGRLNKDDQEVVRQSIQMVGIEELSERMVQTLSDGERQKMMIAKDDVLDFVKEHDFEVLIVLGAGDLDNLVPEMEKILSKRYK